MKQMMIAMVCLVCLFIHAQAAAENDFAHALPLAITDSVEAGTRIEDAILISDTPSGDYAFLLTTQDGCSHTLTWFIQSGDTWTRKGKSNAIVPRGRGEVFMSRHVISPGTGWFSDGDTKPYQDTLGFSIYRVDPEHEEYYMQTVEIHYLQGKWQVIGWQDRSISTEHGYVMDGRICYYDPAMGGAIKSVPLYASFSLNSAFSSLPKTYREAKAEYNDPPALPTGTLHAERVKFAENKVLPVFQGPSQAYGRAGNGKASVSTNDWIQVFGQEDGALMIQYDINSSHMRIGWIMADDLQQDIQADLLQWQDQPCALITEAVLTDDPLFSASPVKTLPADTAVIKLAEMGDWAYIECGDTVLIRGFVKKDMLIELSLRP